MPRRLFRLSTRAEMLAGVLGAFLLLTLSTAYIFISTRKLQALSERAFERERFLSSLRSDLLTCEPLILDYLSTRSSETLSRILIETQRLRTKLPAAPPVSRNEVLLRERELYPLIRSWLDLADRAMEEKRGRNIAAYTAVYEEMSALLDYINREIDEISTGLFHEQMNAYSRVISASGAIQLWNLLLIVFVSLLAALLVIWSDNKRGLLRNMRMESLVRRMEIYALQAQMNPHFLFNTLNTGMQLAILEGADRTGEYMECLAKLFRHIIRNKDLIVPLGHEIEGLRYYFYILKVRFPKNLDLVLDYDEALLSDYRVPVSILQPLVENCIIHAFKEREEGRSLILVRVEKPGDRLILSVRDNGCGMQAETVEQLLHPQSLDESSVSRVMGLENVVQRLYFFYPGDPEVVSIETRPGEGTGVIIRIDPEREPCVTF